MANPAGLLLIRVHAFLPRRPAETDDGGSRSALIRRDPSCYPAELTIYHPSVLALRIFAVVVGAVLVGASIVSAVKTVVMPRARSSAITRSVFLAMRQVFELVARGASDPEQRDRLLAGYAPTALIATLATWLVLVLVGFTLIFWGIEDAGWLHAFDVSGSSLLTLGFTTSRESWTSILVFLEAGIGLFLLALMISYLPSLYAVYARREVGIAALEVRAGSPPSAREMIWRYRRLERLEEIHEVWVDWQRWFAEVEESHSSYPALVFFRGSHQDHSWVTSAGAVLDAASLTVSSVDDTSRRRGGVLYPRRLPVSA